MKYKLFFLGALISTHIFSQNPNYCISTQTATDGTPSPCCNGHINTDYNYPVNPERSDLVNQFNWLTPPSTSSGAATIKINRNGTGVNIDHPFLNDIASRYYWYSNYRIGDPAPYLNNNMHPRFGWQLLYHNFGFDIFTNNPATNVPANFNPVMIYYNKYSGKMRLFTSPGQGNSFDESSVKVGFISGTNLNYSGLLSHNAPRARALDKSTEIEQVTTSIPFASVNTWTGGDIQTTYDPCICKNQSRLLFRFFDQDFSDVYMSGNIVGINRPLDNSGNTPLKFGENFISSVYADFRNSTSNKIVPSSGMLVYNDINQIVANAYVSPNMKSLVDALDIISSIAGPIGKTAFQSDLGEKIGKGLSFASKQLKTTTPQVSFLEAQGAFSGEIKNQSSSGGYGSFEILTPGSFHNFRQTVPWTQQPMYNESLGLFALLKTPKLVFNTLPLDEFEEEYDNKYRGLALVLEEPLEYILNPAADIDITKTKISASIEFDLYDDYNLPMYVNNFQNNLVSAKDYFKPTFFQLSPDNPTEPLFNTNTNEYELVQSRRRVFSTYVLPINKVDDVSYISLFNGGTFDNWETNANPYYTDESYPKFRLRIYAHYVFKPNQYGDINETEQTYLYDIDVRKDFEYNPNGFPCSVASNIFCGKPTLASKVGNDATLGTTNYSTNQTLYYDNLVINGNLSTSNGAKVTVYYSGSVEIKPNGKISPDITIVYNDFVKHDGLIMPSEQYLKNTYCSGSYKANTLKSSVNSIVKKSTNFIISLHPNPSTSRTKLLIENPLSESASIKVFDILGREIDSYQLDTIDSGNNTLEINTERWHRGIYIVKIIHGEVEKSIKLEVQN